MAIRSAFLYGDWDKALNRLRHININMASNLDKATKRNALAVRDAMIRKFVEGDRSWPPLAAATIARKGSSKPLIEHGDLMGSINVKPLPHREFFVGVPRAARSKEGEELVNIGACNEFGTDTIPVRSFVATTLREQDEPTAKRWMEAARKTVLGLPYNG